ncbi:hypothetical protein SeMB42_g03949 [Synchytrium endobioticum]|uniref:Phosphodiesterase n=1 Tax=Synchytrium endobioticum TaxID=286115 RepID=A0A507D5Y8_9FUNG|nr:hypothetical protein SeMB42_g03949 [Synchytrium endobioticum]TPX46883.1 hypothetical protein SeLEV6574_g02974 [Synchytrium endobioticum]
MSTKEVKDLLIAAAADNDPDASDVCKLSKHDGTLIPVSASIPQNTPSTRYRLDIIKNSTESSTSSHSQDVELVIKRLQATALLMNEVQNLKKELHETRAHLDGRAPVNLADKISHPATRRVHELRVNRLIPVASPHFSHEVSEQLKTPTFDVWKYSTAELIGLFEVMFDEFNLFERFKIDRPIFRRFMTAISLGYNENPFHNFKHCFCVTQMCYAILHVSGVHSKLSVMDKLCLLTACIGHDLDHPGFNNAYQINAKTELAIVYNDQSPLENHHCAVLFTLLRQPETNFLSSLKDSEWKDFRVAVVQCILATDMAIHGQIMAKFKGYTDSFNYDDAAQKGVLLQMIVKCSDISNEVRPKIVSEPWVDCLLEEFFHQSDTEKEQGLPTAPFMDRAKVSKPGAQVGFIGFVMIPLYELAARVLPNLEEHIITPIRKALEYYKAMQDGPK